MSKSVVKIANHGPGYRFNQYPTAEALENTLKKCRSFEESKFRNFFSRSLPEISNSPIVYSRLCLYDDSLDGDFLIDRHPKTKNLLIAGGSSGHGAKVKKKTKIKKLKKIQPCSSFFSLTCVGSLVRWSEKLLQMFWRENQINGNITSNGEHKKYTLQWILQENPEIIFVQIFNSFSENINYEFTYKLWIHIQIMNKHTNANY